MDRQQVMALCDMGESLCTLVGLYCAERPAEEKIANWFSGVEFEALRSEVSCMAAAVAAACDYSGVPDALIPRLRGINRYVRTLNSGMTAGLCVLGKRLNEAGIPAVLLGNTAVQLGYPEPPRRHIWQTQISVSEADFPHAAALAEQAGFTLQQTPYSATARNGNTQCVLIRKGAALTGETTALPVGSALFQMPGSGELLVSLCEAIFQILPDTAPGAKLLPQIMDLHCVIASHPDWHGASAAATKRGSVHQVRLVLDLYNALAPNCPAGDFPALFGSENTAAQLAKLLLQYRNIQPGSARLKRLWLSARIRNGNALSGALGTVCAELFRAVIRKFTRGS